MQKIESSTNRASSNTPVLLIIFNRPSLTEKVFESIRENKPTRLFIAADGPRTDRLGEDKLCEQTRNIVSNIDWPCEVYKKFQEKNLGCKWGPITAIDWFFENVNEGIILEDDCLPSQSFFTFCSRLLDYFKDNKQIMHISGDNFQNGILRGNIDSSYYFSKYTHSWGWATWKRAWEQFHPAMKNFGRYKRDNLVETINLSKKAKAFWLRNFKLSIDGNDSWDGIWMYTVWYSNGLAIIPQKNLVKNIGFGHEATHTKDAGRLINTESFNIDNIIHNINIEQDQQADEYTFKTLFNIPITSRLILKLKKIFK